MDILHVVVLMLENRSFDCMFGKTPDHFVFDQFGVRVPAVIVSPCIQKGSIIRPLGNTPFDHTTIAATLRGP